MRFTNEIGFNHGWKFRQTLAAGVEQPGFDDRAFEEVTLPHDWQITGPRDPGMEWGWSQGYYPRNGVGWYRKHLNVPKDWEGRTVWLLIDGCQRFYDVFLNGERIGGRRYGYLPCLLPLTDLKEDNLLAVRVNNSDTLGDRWYSGAGLYRGVRLLVKHPCHIRPFSLQTMYELEGEGAEMTVRADVTQALPGCTALCRLSRADGAVAATAECDVCDSRIEMRFAVPSVHLWDLDDPYLYSLELTLERSGETLDTAFETVGFRTAVFDADQGFLLNGKVRKLYGVNLHHDGGAVFGAALPKEVLRRRLRVLREMGCNAVRCSHNPHAEFLYDLCDEMGFVVIDELYDKWCGSSLYFSKLFDTDRFEDLECLIARDRNHPSIVLWSMGNELEIQYSDRFYALLKEMAEHCRRLDPARPVSLALIGFCMRHYLDDETDLQTKLDLVLRYAELVDVFMGNYMEGYYTALRKAGMRKAIIGSEVFTYYRNAELSASQTVWKNPWDDVRQRDYVAGGFVWAGVDYLGEAGDYPSRGWTGCPVDSTGWRKLRAWYLASRWKETPVLRLGFLDDGAYDDGARANWGFPLMRGDWHARRRDLFQHVCVMTNCDEVRLYLNDDVVRRCSEYGSDGMMHLLVPYVPGVLRAEGWRQGIKVIEQVLHSSERFAAIRATCADPVGDGEVAQIDLELLDEYGQLWERSTPAFTVSVAGDAELVGLDHGDLLDDGPETAKDACRFHLGHAIAYVRPGASGHFSLTVTCQDLQTRFEM